MEMMSQNAGASSEKKRNRKTKLKHEIEMMRGASGETKQKRRRPLKTIRKTIRKRKGCSIMKHYRDQCGDKNNSSEPDSVETDSVEMINHCPATREAATIPRKEDLESDLTLMALYKRWCFFWEINRTHAEMVKRLKYFRKEAEMVYKQNQNKSSCDSQLFYFADLTSKENRRPPICPPISRRLRV